MKKITKIKTKYYSKIILKYLLTAGVICVAASSPYFALNLIKGIKDEIKKSGNQKRKAVSAFYYLKRKGLIETIKDGFDVKISLTKKGKKLAGKYQIDELMIAKPKKWDKKWRLVIFDIPNSSGLVRNVFRKKLKEFGFYALQKSIWIYPFDCKQEIALLRDFLGADKRQIQVLEVTKLEEDKFLKKFFHL